MYRCVYTYVYIYIYIHVTLIAGTVSPKATFASS